MLRSVFFALIALTGSIGSVQSEQLEADLSTHYIEIRTTFRGATVTVFGAVPEAPPQGKGRAGLRERPLDVIVVVRGPPAMIAVRRTGEVGPIWVARESFTAINVPSVYYVASTRPLARIADADALSRYRIGFDNLDVAFAPGRVTEASLGEASERAAVPAYVQSDGLPEPFDIAVVPGVQKQVDFDDALIRLMQHRGVYGENRALRFVRPHLFRTEIAIPSNVPTGAYGAEVYLVRDKEIVGAEYSVFFIRKRGLEGKIYGLARDDPFWHGLLCVSIAVFAGWLSDYAFRKR